MKIPNLIALEGVDGAGKTTVTGLVAEGLRQHGYRVFLPRDSVQHRSQPAHRIRELTRDSHNLDLTARAELALYCAREAQILEESVKPALARGEIVLTDRSFLTPIVLGAYGRGLQRETCESMASAAADGLQPDVTLIFDVHPRTSRMRKRIEKVRLRSAGGGGRKGLSGSGLKERVRDGYLAIAKERNIPVFHAERASPHEVAARVLTFLTTGARPEHTETALDAKPHWMVDAHASFTEALDGLPAPVALLLANGLVAGRALRHRLVEQEPQLVAWSLDADDPTRSICLHAEVDYALRGWSKRPLTADDARLTLIDLYPDRVLSTLKYQTCTASDELRSSYATLAPSGVLASLAGREDDLAQTLRRHCWKQGTLSARAASITRCSGSAAWQLRNSVFERSVILGLESLRGLSDSRTNQLLETYALKAEKCVLHALGGRSDEFAYRIRHSLNHVGREVIDSVRGLDDNDAWVIRERFAETHPSTVLHSLTGIVSSRAAALRLECERRGAGDLHVLRRSVGLDEFTWQPAWAQSALAAAED